MFNCSAYVQHWLTLLTRYTRTPPRRYKEILQYVAKNTIHSIIEIGVYSGRRAMEIITAASIRTAPENIEYFGFDLFEDLTPELCMREFSKKPLPKDVVATILKLSGARISLLQGNTLQTLPLFTSVHRAPPDLVFIDGGHTEETIASDWQNVAKLMGPRTVVFFDDYYTNSPTEVPGIGCQKLINNLDQDKYDVSIGTIEDCFQKEWGVLKIRLARVSLRTPV